MSEQELCIYCGKPMVLRTEHGGYRTYGCKTCPYHTAIETSTGQSVDRHKLQTRQGGQINDCHGGINT